MERVRREAASFTLQSNNATALQSLPEYSAQLLTYSISTMAVPYLQMQPGQMPDTELLRD